MAVETEDVGSVSSDGDIQQLQIQFCSSVSQSLLFWSDWGELGP